MREGVESGRTFQAEGKYMDKGHRRKKNTHNKTWLGEKQEASYSGRS